MAFGSVIGFAVQYGGATCTVPVAGVELEPWPEDIAFARGVDLLRGHVRRAYERAGKTG